MLSHKGDSKGRLPKLAGATIKHHAPEPNTRPAIEPVATNPNPCHPLGDIGKAGDYEGVRGTTMWRVLLVVAILASPNPALAQFVYGNELYKWLQAGKRIDNSTNPEKSSFTDLRDAELGRGYVSAVVDAIGPLNYFFCLQRGTIYSPGQMIDITLQYLERHPAERHLTAATLVIRALKEAFPCK